MKTVHFVALLAALSLLSACGGVEKRLEKEQIRSNADDATAELDRESAKSQDQNR